MPPEVENAAELQRVSTELQAAYFKRAEAVKKLRDAQRQVDSLTEAIRALESERANLVAIELGEMPRVDRPSIADVMVRERVRNAVAEADRNYIDPETVARVMREEIR